MKHLNYYKFKIIALSYLNKIKVSYSILVSRLILYLLYAQAPYGKAHRWESRVEERATCLALYTPALTRFWTTKFPKLLIIVNWIDSCKQERRGYFNNNRETITIKFLCFTITINTFDFSELTVFVCVLKHYIKYFKYLCVYVLINQHNVKYIA